jgi:hypothetical protein
MATQPIQQLEEKWLNPNKNLMENRKDIENQTLKTLL